MQYIKRSLIRYNTCSGCKTRDRFLWPVKTVPIGGLPSRQRETGRHRPPPWPNRTTPGIGLSNQLDPEIQNFTK